MPAADALGAQHAHAPRVAHVDLGELRDLALVARKDAPASAVERTGLRDHEQALAVEQQLMAEAVERQAAEQLQAVRADGEEPLVGDHEDAPAAGLHEVGLVDTQLLDVGARVAGLGLGGVAADRHWGRRGRRGGYRLAGQRDRQIGDGRRDRARPLASVAAPVADDSLAGPERLQPCLLRKPLALPGRGLGVAGRRDRERRAPPRARRGRGRRRRASAWAPAYVRLHGVLLQSSSSRTAALLTEIERALPERPFSIVLWDGSRLPSTSGDGPTFTARSRTALAHVLRAPGQLGLGRAYVSGALEVDDIDAVLELLRDWQPPADRRPRARPPDARGRPRLRDRAPAARSRRRSCARAGAATAASATRARCVTTTTSRTSSSRSSSTSR